MPVFIYVILLKNSLSDWLCKGKYFISIKKFFLKLFSDFNTCLLFVGLSELESETFTLSVWCSNLLSYSPLFVGIPGLEPRTSASETDVLTNYTHIPIYCRGSRTRTDSTCSQSTQATIKPHTPKEIRAIGYTYSPILLPSMRSSISHC